MSPRVVNELYKFFLKKRSFRVVFLKRRNLRGENESFKHFNIIEIIILNFHVCFYKFLSRKWKVHVDLESIQIYLFSSYFAWTQQKNAPLRYFSLLKMVLLFFRSEHGQFQKCSCPYRISSMPQALIRKISYKRKLEDRGRDT